MFGANYHFLLFFTFLNFLCVTSKIPSVLLCADMTCNSPISVAQGLSTYVPGDKNVLGFKKGMEIIIISKSKNKDEYWGAKIGNYVGFVPSNFVKEMKVYKRTEELIEVSNSKIAAENTPEMNEKRNLDQVNVEDTVTLSNIIRTVNTPHKNSDPIPLANLIQGDIHSRTAQFDHQEIKNESQEDNENSYSSEPNQPNTESSVDHTDTSLFNELSNKQGVVENDKSGVATSSSTYEDVTDAYKKEEVLGSNLILNASQTDHVSLNRSVLSNVGHEEQVNNIRNGTVDSRKVDENQNVVAQENDPGNKIEENPLNKNENILENETSVVNVTSLGNIDSVKNDYKNDNNGNSYVVHSEDGNSQKDSPISFKSEFDGSDKSQKHSNDIVSDANEIYLGRAGVTRKADPNEYVSVSGKDSTEKEESSQDKESSKNLGFNIDVHSEGNTLSTGKVALENNNNEVRREDEIKLNEIVNIDGEVKEEIAAEETSPITSNSLGSYGNVSSDIYGNNYITNTINSTSSHSSSSSSSSDRNISGSKDVRVIEGSTDYELDTVVGEKQKHGVDDVRFYNLPAEQQSREESTDLGNSKKVIPARTEFGLNSDLEDIPHVHDSDSFLNKDQIIRHESYQPVSPSQENDLPPEFTHFKKPGELSSETVHDNHDEFNKNIVETDINVAQMERNEEKIKEKLQNEISTPSMEYTVGVKEVSAGGMDDYLTSKPYTKAPDFPSMEKMGELAENNAELNVDTSANTDFMLPNPTESTNEYNENTNEVRFYSKIVETVLSWFTLGRKTEEEGSVHYENSENIRQDTSEFDNKETKQVSDSSHNKCDDSEHCHETYSSPYISSLPWNFWMDNKNSNLTTSYNTLIYLVVTAITVLLFTLGYYFIEQFRSDGSLIAKVNRLEQELLVSSKECLLLKDELINTKEKLTLFETSSNDKIITALQLELEESKKIKLELENNIEVLQQELDSATEAGLDLNRMLSEVLTQKGGSETLMESVEHLQAQLNNQQKIIDEMTSKLIAKSKENQDLQGELATATDKIESLENEIEEIRGNLNVHLKENEDVISVLTAKNNELQIKINTLNEAKDKEMIKLKKNLAESEKKLKSLSESLKLKEGECNNLKDSFRKLKNQDSKNYESLFDASRIKSELTQSESNNKLLKERLKMLEEEHVKLENDLKQTNEELQKFKQISSDAEKEKAEAQTRLEVLSNYFKEKETQLQKELGLREAMWVKKQGDDSTVYEKMKSLEEEINSYKSQNETLKKEILDQERSLKAQITTLEKKAHENWIAARQAERKLEESKQEAAQLRNKLTLMEKNLSNDLDSGQHSRVNEEMNGGDTLSPLVHDTSSPIIFPPPLPMDPNGSSLMPPGFIPPPMFMPPPPGGFMPPPPFLPGDHRPPPLGRMSSPPLNNRFSPPPPDYAYDRMSTPPLSPSSRNYRSPNESERDRERFRHRTPTSPSFRSGNWEDGPGFRPISSERDARREHKGGSNLSSGHSSDSLDKSSRHSGRV